MKPTFKNEARQRKFSEDRSNKALADRNMRNAVLARGYRPDYADFKRRERLDRHKPHQSYRQAVRARTKPGSDDRHLGFEVAKLAAANVGTARKDFATFLDSLV